MPGRTRKRPARSDSWPCVVCSENCLLCSVQCNACKKWVHASCNGLTDKDLEYVSRNLPYMCNKCTLDADGGVYSYNSAMLRLREVRNHLSIRYRPMVFFHYCYMYFEYASSEDSGESVHLRRLVWFLVVLSTKQGCRQMIKKSPLVYLANNMGKDQTVHARIQKVLLVLILKKFLFFKWHKK